MTIARSINVICGHYPIQSLWPLPQHKTHIATLYIYCWTSTLMCCPFIYGDTYCRTWMHIYIYHFSLHANHSETYGSFSGMQAYCCVVCCLSDESGSKEGIACKLSGTSKWCDAGGLRCAYLALWRRHFFFLWHVHSSLFWSSSFFFLFVFLSSFSFFFARGGERWSVLWLLLRLDKNPSIMGSACHAFFIGVSLCMKCASEILSLLWCLPRARF